MGQEQLHQYAAAKVAAAAAVTAIEEKQLKNAAAAVSCAVAALVDTVAKWALYRRRQEAGAAWRCCKEFQEEISKSGHEASSSWRQRVAPWPPPNCSF